jgi:ferredoxin
VDDDVAYRLLRLEQRLTSYEELHAQELGEMREELDVLKRQVVLRTRYSKAPTIHIDVTACNGCGQCMSACLHGLFELKAPGGRQIVGVVSLKASNGSQACAECLVETPPCVQVCAPGAITLR